MGFQAVDIRHVGKQTRFYQLIDELFSQPLDIHCASRGIVANCGFLLRATHQPSGTAIYCLIRFLFHRRTTNRAELGEHHLASIGLTALIDH